MKEYEDRLVQLAPPLAGVRVVLDCANGATYRVAPAVLLGAGATVRVLNDRPDGLNINAMCGSNHPDGMREAVVAEGADVGFAFDGDGDRVVIADHTGALHDGDTVLAIAARHASRAGMLRPSVVVGTVMSNGGVEATLRREGIELVRTQVGDRYVWEELERRDAQFGGEPSGHVIFRGASTTGDGILTALEVLALVHAEGKPLAELAADIERWPQITRNVRAPRRRDWREGAFGDLVRDAEAQLDGSGRLVVRASGTEPVLRITVEAREPGVAQRVADRLATAAAEALA